MSFKTRACITIHCETCDQTLDYDGMTPHFDTEAEARDAAEEHDWLTLDDGIAYCFNDAPPCLCDDCEDDGCDWGQCPDCPRHGKPTPTTERTTT